MPREDIVEPASRYAAYVGGIVEAARFHKMPVDVVPYQPDALIVRRITALPYYIKQRAQTVEIGQQAVVIGACKALLLDFAKLSVDLACVADGQSEAFGVDGLVGGEVNRKGNNFFEDVDRVVLFLIEEIYTARVESELLAVENVSGRAGYLKPDYVIRSVMRCEIHNVGGVSYSVVDVLYFQIVKGHIIAVLSAYIVPHPMLFVKNNFPILQIFFIFHCNGQPYMLY